METATSLKRKLDQLDRPTQDIVANMVEEARRLGYQQGHDEGYQEGYQEGYDEGVNL